MAQNAASYRICLHIYAHQTGWEERGKHPCQIMILQYALTIAHRTLQEGVLSENLVFQLKGSSAHLRVLWNYVESKLSYADAWMFRLKPKRRFLTQHQATESVVDLVRYSTGMPEPFRVRISSELHIFLTASLNLDEYRDYALEPVSKHRAALGRTATKLT